MLKNALLFPVSQSNIQTNLSYCNGSVIYIKLSMSGTVLDALYSLTYVIFSINLMGYIEKYFFMVLSHFCMSGDSLCSRLYFHAC